MVLDFNDADKQGGGGGNEPLAPGTYKLKTLVRPGGAGPDGMLKLAKNLSTLMLDLEFTVVSGSYTGRKLWEYWIVGVEEGEPSEGIATAAGITRGRIRALLESAHGYEPADESDAAKQARRIDNYEELSGLQFVARVGIKKGDGVYKDKNNILEILTPADRSWLGFNPKHPRVTGAAGAPVAPKRGGLADDLDDLIPF